MTTTDPTRHRVEVIAGLRALADLLETTPGLPVPAFGLTVRVFDLDNEHGTGRGHVDRVAALLAVTPGDNGRGHYTARATLPGPVVYEALHISDAAYAAHNAQMSYCDNIVAADTTAADLPDLAEVA